jgi:hypothetical protein
MTSYTLDNILQFFQLEQNNLLENPRILSQERNMAPDLKDKPSWTCFLNLLRIHEDMIGRSYVYMATVLEI